MILYGLKNCDTCRKARKALPGFAFQDVREDGLPETVLDDALAQLGAQLLNTRSTTWRGLDEETRAQDPRDLIIAHPALMKRPLIVVDNSYFLGWNKQVEADVQARI